MLLRAVVPVGWMPGTTDNHQATLVVCTMDASGLMVMDHPVPPKSDPGQDRHHETCPYAMTAFVVVPTVVGTILPSYVAVVVRDIEARQIPASARVHAPQNPRAPPLSA